MAPKLMLKNNVIADFYATLSGVYGPQHWWPAMTAFEMIVGAYLTQNTAWTNVELAFANMRKAGILSLEGMRSVELAELEQAIRPAGYFRQKAARLKAFVAHLDEAYGGSLEKMFARPTNELRKELLSLNGVGPETADSILLYAGQHVIFVVDAYTRRIFERHHLIRETTPYEEIREGVEVALAQFEEGPEGSAVVRRAPQLTSHYPVPPVHSPTPLSEAPRSAVAQRYNEFHALIVQVGKHLCQSREPKCELCPLARYLPPSGPKLGAEPLRKRRTTAT